MPIAISRLTEADIPGAVTAIQEAFADDPYNLWVFSDREKLNLARNRVSLSVKCRWGIKHALFYVAKDTDSNEPDKVLGIAMWLPPKPVDQKQSWNEWFGDWKMWIEQGWTNYLFAGRGGLNLKRYQIWKDRQSEAQSEIWKDPRGYYFLNIMVVLPGQQGQGIGGTLASEVTKQADLEGRKCYLESSRDEPNVKIYEKMGFKTVRELDCNDAGTICKLYCMVREPKMENSLPE